MKAETEYKFWWIFIPGALCVLLIWIMLGDIIKGLQNLSFEKVYPVLLILGGLLTCSGMISFFTSRGLERFFWGIFPFIVSLFCYLMDEPIAARNMACVGAVVLPITTVFYFLRKEGR